MNYLISIVFASFLVLYAQLSVAIPDFWNESAYAIECKETPLREVLNDFSSSFNVDLVISGNINKVCNGWKRADTAAGFLDHIGSQNQVQWFYYRNTLYFSPTSDYKTLRLSVSGSFKGALEGLGLFQEKFGWGYLEEDEAVIVSGPSKYVDFVRDLSKKEEEVKEEAKKKEKEKEEKEKGNGDIHVFPLKHASVSDRTLVVRNQPMVIPGVATILKGLLQNQFGFGGHDSPKEKSEKKSGEIDIASPAHLNNLNFGQITGDNVYVEGDVRTNSIIIRSKNASYSFYETLIKRLDTPSNLVEIDAIIVDISREKLTELGTNFSRRRRDDGGSTLFIKDLGEFYARLKALEGKGSASIIANTSILTMENQPAVIDLSETAYIRSVGERIVDVLPVTAGTLLNVIPQTIHTEEGSKIKLVVNIEDGKLVSSSDNAGESTPTVRKTTISTKALIDQNRSLVIGGYHRQTRRSHSSGVPFLKDVPIVKSAFSSKFEKDENIERLFILTPRISPTHHNPESHSTEGGGALISEMLEKIRHRWSDADRSYLKKAQDLLVVLASGKIPLGYEMVKLKKHKNTGFHCSQSGIEHHFKGAQKIAGNGLEAYVGIVINRSEGRLKVQESFCRGKGLIAVSLFPNDVLESGEATEIFVVMESALKELKRKSTLTSL